MQKLPPMRYLILLILTLSCCNISHNNKEFSQNKNLDSLYSNLENIHFLQYTDSSIIDSVRQSFFKNGYIFSQEINRYVHIDAEELSEGSFDFFKADLTRVINK